MLFLYIIFMSLSCSSQMEIMKVELKTDNQSFSNENLSEYLLKAYKFFEDEKYDSVFTYCQKSIDFNPPNWKPYFLYGKTARKTGRYKLAADYYYRALSNCKSSRVDRAEIYFELGENENILGNLKTAKQHYLMVIQLDNGSELAKTAYKNILLLTTVE